MRAMTPLQLKKLVIEILNDRKALDIIALDVRKLTTITDYMIICSGTSGRHVSSIAKNLVAEMKQRKNPPFGIEQESNEWVLVDLSDVIVHVMLPETRELYDLESLWSVDIAKKSRAKAQE